MVTFFLPSKGLDYQVESGDKPPVMPQKVMLALAGIFIMYIGYGGLWVLAQQIGIASGLETDFIAGSLSLALYAAIPSLFIPMFLQTKLGRLAPIAFAILCLIAMSIFLFQEANLYRIGLCAGAFGIYLIIPYMSGVIADPDTSGKGLVMITPIPMC